MKIIIILFILSLLLIIVLFCIIYFFYRIFKDPLKSFIFGITSIATLILTLLSATELIYFGINVSEDGYSKIYDFILSVIILFDLSIGTFQKIKSKEGKKDKENDNNTDELDRKLLEQLNIFGNEKFEKGKKIGYELGEKDGIKKGKQQAYVLLNSKLENKNIDKDKINKCKIDKCKEHINNTKD